MSKPIPIKTLNLQNINRSPTPNQYQKVRIQWPPKEQIDRSYVCIFCNLNSSPRSTTPIVAKSNILSWNKISPTNCKLYIEYSCNDCVLGLKSQTYSPRVLTSGSPNTSLEFSAPGTSFSPRDISDMRGEKIRRRKSINDRSGTDISSQLVRAKSLNGKTINRFLPSRLRRSKTMASADIEQHLKTSPSRKNESP